MVREGEDNVVRVQTDDGVPLIDGWDPEENARRIDRLVELFKSHLHIELSKEERETLVLAKDGKPVDPFTERCALTSVMGSLLANHTSLSFLSANHTSDMVEVTSWGPGSEQIPPMIDNNDLHAYAVKAMGLAPAKPV